MPCSCAAFTSPIAPHERPRVFSGAGMGSRAVLVQERAWQVDLNTWKVGDPRYAGVDTELTMGLTTFWFFCNRPTVATLMGLGTDMAAAARGAVSAPAGEVKSAADTGEGQQDDPPAGVAPADVSPEVLLKAVAPVVHSSDGNTSVL